MALSWRNEEGFRIADGRKWIWRLRHGPKGHWVLWRREKASNEPEQVGLFATEDEAKRQAQDLEDEPH